ncbi:hypothetical protein H8F24_12420 [Synechococcus sp. CBW1002]|uniref:hypothetical protein n=1 Tax=Synechococcus sp. CBW1002 TaxID=1353134 RepID=UPI0018CEC32C|nr:hypothetical protein [Synechococcus sp. CBW1002]QPN58924.1 hypothetical protein H8F24_12420 [Synechococcus sp. CBW1002]
MSFGYHRDWCAIGVGAGSAEHQVAALLADIFKPQTPRDRHRLMLSRYDIVLVAFPFTDGPAAKPRPALVITARERHGDVLLALQTESQQVLQRVICSQG